nr:MAG TPA: hypothetical protein [Caudoviricetes sp.]DAQ95490.1 MAG TPA: hypothetical protein [Caudoviricetes sp.]
MVKSVKIYGQSAAKILLKYRIRFNDYQKQLVSIRINKFL